MPYRLRAVKDVEVEPFADYAAPCFLCSVVEVLAGEGGVRQLGELRDFSKSLTSGTHSPVGILLTKQKSPLGPRFAREGVKVLWCVLDCAGGGLDTIPTPVPSLTPVERG